MNKKTKRNFTPESWLECAQLIGENDAIRLIRCESGCAAKYAIPMSCYRAERMMKYLNLNG